MNSATSSRPPSVNETLIVILREDLDLRVESVTATTRLIDDLGMDSVAFAAGLVAIEDRLGVQLTEEDILTCNTVADLQVAINTKASA
ncbi:acyl carrier protein [Mycobacterium montefiorense]|uniref:acyl carrier protein n=1 Tax=Mycobacterium montefiorense TaxID=154654 RepID=UPI000D5969B7|nr:acyl carrier protein [Mycobacterium montefiorense]